MPHMTVDYSANLEEQIDIRALCQALHRAMVETGMFEIGGIRVRALRVDHCVIADDDPQNAYVHLSLRVGAGRSVEDRKAAGEYIYKAAVAYLADLFATPHFALSFVMDELDADLNWKKNSMHARLRGA